MSEKELQDKETSQSCDVFFSYSHRDDRMAVLLQNAISTLGYTVFFDHRSLEGDDEWQATIAKNIKSCKGVLFFRTPNSVDSKWCQREINIADEYGKRILPIAFLHDQNALPISDAIVGALSSLQTSFIAEGDSIGSLQNKLRGVLEQSLGAPQGKEGNLLLTEFILSATENLNHRYESLFQRWAAEKIKADVCDDRIVFKWRFFLGDTATDICVALNKYSKRPDCYVNCKKESPCPVYAEKNQEGYVQEAYLDFIERSRKSNIYDLLESLLGKMSPRHAWCGNQSLKYFFRERIEKCRDANEDIPFRTAIQFLEEVVKFYDMIFAKLDNYLTFAFYVCEIFRKKEIVADVLKDAGQGEWSLSEDMKSHQKIHFHKEEKSSESLESLRSKLGIYSSVAIQYPEALRIKIKEFTPQGINLCIYKYELCKYNYEGNMQLKEEILLSPGKSPKEIRKKIKDSIATILKKECTKPFSTLPVYFHESMKTFVHNDPPLCWRVTQDNPSDISATGHFQGFPHMSFVVRLENHSGKETVNIEQHIISDFIGASERTLSEITGFPIVTGEKIQNSKSEVEAYMMGVSAQLFAIHKNVYARVYLKLKSLVDVLGKWRPCNAATELFLDSTRRSSVEGFIKNEACWEYYLSPGTRLCRRLRKTKNEGEFPVMFSIHFGDSGAGNASIGWYANHEFDCLNPREKELFWRYIITQFPEELRTSFVYGENGIFLAEEMQDVDGNHTRKVKLFPTNDEVKELLEKWTKEEDCLLERMFSVIEKTVEVFKIKPLSR